MAEEEKQEDSKDRFKRAPSKQVAIKDLNPELSRVSLVGTVVSKNPQLYSFMIDDGTGTVLVLTNNIDKFNNIQEGFVAFASRVPERENDS